jgi:hypothetical protein
MKPAKKTPIGSSKRARLNVLRERTAEPRLPHERDESADSQQRGDTQPSEIGRKAFEDIRAGRVDTDRGPVLEELFRTKLQRNDQPSGPRKTRRTR